MLVGSTVSGQQPSALKPSGTQPHKIPGTEQAGNVAQRGSKELPLVVDTEGHTQTEAEAKKSKEREDGMLT